MGDIKGFLKLARQNSQYRAVCERICDFKEVSKILPERESQEQASRCMDCSTPFCHAACPLGNYIPEWNDHVFSGNWKDAVELLESTNNFPEVTGRLCPAPCEYGCVLGLNDDAVTIRENELAIAEFGFRNGLIKPRPVRKRTQKQVAVVGSGPAGLSCAAQLNRAGHRVVVFERSKLVGGILRYGIPDFKLEKEIIDRRIDIFEQEGVEFKTGINVGPDYSAKKILKDFDAVCLAGGCGVPRDIKVEAREAKGIYFAMEYLTQSNQRLSKEIIPADKLIDAKGKKVVVIGGGDTGADCVGTAHRQGASCVTQIEVLPQAPNCRTEAYPWPAYPLLLKTTTSHEEGAERLWAVLTKRFIQKEGFLKGISCVKVEFIQTKGQACPAMKEIPGSEFEITADLAIIAIGFLCPQHSGLLEDINVEIDERGNVKTNEFYMTSVKKVFSAGDMRRGQSLVVWAILEGRRSGYFIDKYLMGRSNLPLI